MSNIVNIDDYRKKEPEFFDIANMPAEKLMQLYNDIMNSESDIDKVIREAGQEITRSIINTLVELGAEPDEENLQQDMIFVTMLFTAGLEEYFTGRHKKGEGNTMYEYLEAMREGVFE